MSEEAEVKEEEEEKEEERLAREVEIVLHSDDRVRGPNEVFVTDLIQCFRRSWFEMKFRARPRPTPVMVLGRLLHDALPGLFFGSKRFLGARWEVECSHDLGNGWALKGRADCVTEDAVIEFKFTREPEFNPAKAMYYAQVSAYCFMLGKVKGYLVLIDRNSMKVKAYPCEPDEDVWKNMLDRARLLIDSLEGDVPVNDSPLFEWECKHCPWSVICSKLKG